MGGFIATLKRYLSKELSVDFTEFKQSGSVADKVEAELMKAIDACCLIPTQHEDSRLWPSIDHKDPLAAASIINNIKKSLAEQTRDTTVTLVGVSLKYSLELLDRALEEFSKTLKRSPEVPRKKLTVRLVYMDDNSHILYALHDQVDISRIRTTLHRETDLFEHWRELFQETSIEVQFDTPTVIDYIPPRIGTLIDENVLYAGRCCNGPQSFLP
jgi:hypothetical protein